MTRTHLYNVADQIRQYFILLDLLSVVSNLFLHDALLVLQP